MTDSEGLSSSTSMWCAVAANDRQRYCYSWRGGATLDPRLQSSSVGRGIEVQHSK